MFQFVIDKEDELDQVVYEMESQKWMENKGNSYWYTPEGLHEGNVALLLDSDKLCMSEQGKEVLKGFELDLEFQWNEDIVVRDEITNEVVAVYPYYVGDGGITFGYGHYMDYDEVMEYQDEKDLFTKYVNGIEINPEIFDDGLGLKVRPRIVPGSVPVPLEELNQLFEEDVEKMTEDMLENFDKSDLMITNQQVDALMLIRFNTGHLGPNLVSLVENGATKEEWDKVINSQSSNRKIRAKEIYWGNIFSYNTESTEEECAE